MNPNLRLVAFLATACLLLAGACGDEPTAAPAPGDDGGTPGRLCARPAEGCPCEPGQGSVRCYVDMDEGEGRQCTQGEMFCRGGFWSGCEDLDDVVDRLIGGAQAALITPPAECSGCNPDCGRATDYPDCGDLTASNSSNVLCDPGGGITLDTRAPPDVPTCAEEFAGLPPGGTYEEFCAGAGTLFLLAPGATSSVCSDQLAADTFQNALCSCEDLDGTYALQTGSFNSTGASSDGLTAHVATNGLILLGGASFIGGDLTGWGTGTHNPVRNLVIEKNMYVNGALVMPRVLTVGNTMGDLYINGDATLFETHVQAGAGFLHMPATATLTPTSATQDYMLVAEPVTVDKPCGCDPSELVDISGFVASTSTRNDNDVIGLDPDFLNGTVGGTFNLPCGRFYTHTIDTSTNLTINAEGRTALFIDGDLRSGAALTINLADPSAEVDVFISGTIDSSASINFGSATYPEKVRVYVGGSADIDLSASGVFNGNFYAPNANVIFGGAVTVNGSLFVRHLTGGSAVTINYDEAVRSVDCPPIEGRYSRDYDASEFCGLDGEIRPDWSTFTWNADVPAGQSIRFEIRTAETQAGLATATPVSFVVPPSGVPVDVGDLLVAGGEENYLPFLRVTAVLVSDGLDAPLLYGFELEWNCSLGTSGVTSPADWTCVGTPAVCTQACPAEVCDDGIDNNCDGNADCDDVVCAADSLCCAGEICGDGINNDCDDLEDFFDPECDCSAEICDDGLDNDGDTMPDCADTTDCPDGTACDAVGSLCSGGVCVCPNATEIDCGDALDNDCDGLVDCGDDDCGPLDGCARPEACDNAIDDDLDTLTDCADVTDCPTGSGCGANGELCNDVTMACECPGGATEFTCDDNLDEDCDGAVDCVDTDCICVPETCTDGIDNDGDTLVDCADGECNGMACGANGLVCSAGLCECPTGTAESACDDGADNNCDGVVDCADTAACPDGTACGADGLECAAGACACPGGTTEAACVDGLDNDCDGLFDCFDADCGCVPEICDDAVDNDTDTLIDCDDADCDGQSCGPNGLICASSSCVCPTGAVEFACDDGADNDCDGLADCADPDCDGIGSCCPSGCTCSATCDASGCNCSSGCPCDFTCVGGLADCTIDCRSGSRCTIDSTLSGYADILCDGGSDCTVFVDRNVNGDVDCNGNGTTCDVTCQDSLQCDVRCRSGAECLLRCQGSGTCEWENCPGGGSSCPTGELVCNRSCP